MPTSTIHKILTLYGLLAIYRSKDSTLPGASLAHGPGGEVFFDVSREYSFILVITDTNTLHSILSVAAPIYDVPTISLIYSPRTARRHWLRQPFRVPENGSRTEFRAR